MGDEQQSKLAAGLVAKLLVVQGSDNGPAESTATIETW